MVQQAVTQATVFFCETGRVECRTSIDSFETNRLRDLFVFVAWRGISGVHTQELHFELPGGSHYQTIRTRFTTEAAAPSADIQVVQFSRGEPTTVSVLPVAGTFITQRSLLGTWAVRVYLDGALVTTTNFTLQPR